MKRANIHRWRKDPAEDGDGWLIMGDRRTLFADIYGPHGDGTYTWAVIVGALSASGEAPTLPAAKARIRRLLKRAHWLLARDHTRRSRRAGGGRKPRQRAAP